MTEFIGVYSARGFKPGSLKREALLFDRIAIESLEDYLLELKEGLYPSHYEAAELEWLHKENIVFNPETDITSVIEQSSDAMSALSTSVSLQHHQQDIMKRLPTHVFNKDGTTEFIEGDGTVTPENALEIVNINHEINSLLVRITSIGLNLHNNYEVCSICKIPQKLRTYNIPVEPSNVLQLVLSKLPIPNELTPWENIIEFRKDSDNKERLALLRNWIYAVCHREINQKEANTELESLLYQYEKALKIYEIKYSHGILETFITTTADILENLVKFKYGDIARALFNIRRRKVDLLEAEINAPGRMISHITYVQKKFTR